jgi:hypothetical protein
MSWIVLIVVSIWILAMIDSANDVPCNYRLTKNQRLYAYPNSHQYLEQHELKKSRA